MNILIVEEGEAMRRLIRSVVCASPHSCHECPDGSHVVAAYARHRPDWVLPDWVLPDWVLPDWVLIDSEMKTADGVAVAGQIYAAFPEAKILIITGYDDADLRQAALAAGACGCALKENLIALRELISNPLNNNWSGGG